MAISKGDEGVSLLDVATGSARRTREPWQQKKAAQTKYLFKGKLQ